MIPESAVEAAASAYCNQRKYLGYLGWDELAEDGREWRRDQMRAALEAAAPHILREAKAEAWEEGKRACNLEWQQTFDLVTPDEDRFVATNPYRSQP